MSREQMVAKVAVAIEGISIDPVGPDRGGYWIGREDAVILAAAAVDAVLEVLAPDEVWEWKTPKSEEL